MASGSSNLYRWERVSKPRVYSRSQRVTTDSEIQDWIKTVENASDRAAASAFGRPAHAQSTRQRVKATVDARVQDAQLYEAAYAEAQDLLNQWVNDKIKLDAEADLSDEAWNRQTQADIKREWSQLLSSDADLEIDEMVHSEREYSDLLSARSKDPYAMLRQDPDDLVDEVINRMYDTDVISDAFTRDLGLDNDVTKYPDPRTKMTLRHQQVKENREKRLREKEHKLRQLQSKKEANFKARQIVRKEEKVKESRKKKEEAEIQAEMAKIKKEMEEERRKQEEERLRMKKEKEEMERRAKEEYERHKTREDKQRRKTEYLTEERRKLILGKMQEIETRRVTENLRLKQRCFSAWYNLVIDKRLKTGRAKAMSDWRLLLRTFNAWKLHTREKSLVQQAWAHEEHMKQFNRKANMAEEYWRHTLLRKCMTAWQLFVHQSQVNKDVKREQEKTKSKMAAFLQAAASGKLWKEGEDGNMSGRSEATAASRSTVSAMFTGGVRPQRSGMTSQSTTARSAASGAPPKQTHRPDGPSDAWQIKRKHIQVTKKELEAVNAKNKTSPQTVPQCSCDGVESGDQSNRLSPCAKCQGTSAGDKQAVKTWKKAPFVVSNFEHRHAAQQRILEMQQKQIQEQQRLIEELQYLQKQQMLQQKLLRQESAKAKINDSGATDTNGVDNIHRTLTHLQNHIAKLQQQLLENSESQLNTVDVSGMDSSESGRHESTVHDIQITDLESDSSPRNSAAVNQDLKLDLSTFVDEAEKQETKSIKSKNGATLPNTFGNTTVLSTAQPSSVRSDASSQVSSQVSSTARTGASRHETFLKSMEERARDRQRQKKERELKRLKEEEEKMAELLEREAELREREEEQKHARITAHREKKRLEKQKEKEKHQLVERMKELNEIAEAHYKRSLLKWRGVYAFKKLVSLCRQKAENANQHYRSSLLRKVLVSWRGNVRQEIEQKNKMADQFYNYLVIKRCFYNWTKFKEAQWIQWEKARRHREARVKVRVIRHWLDWAAEEKVAGWHRERLAREHDLVRIKKKYFYILRWFPEKRREQEERERRRAEMRRKVAGMLSDYSGVTTSQSVSASKNYDQL